MEHRNKAFAYVFDCGSRKVTKFSGERAEEAAEEWKRQSEKNNEMITDEIIDGFEKRFGVKVRTSLK